MTDKTLQGISHHGKGNVLCRVHVFHVNSLCQRKSDAFAETVPFIVVEPVFGMYLQSKVAFFMATT